MKLQSLKKQKAVFFDRDGVINKLIVIKGEMTSPKSLEQFKIFPYASQVISRIRKDYLAIVITNQPDIARGKMSKQELKKINRKLYELVEIDDLFVCMHDDEDNCQCRKPKPGMILEAASKWNINLQKSIIIGDSWRDMLAGKRAGLNTCYINHLSSVDGVVNRDFEFDFEAENLLGVTKYLRV